MNVCDAIASPVQVNKRANTQHRSICGSFYKRRVSRTGRGGGGKRGSRISQERPAALETAPEGWRPRSAAPGRWGLRGRRPLRRGRGPTPQSWTAGLRPHCLLEATSSRLLLHPPKYPGISPERQPRVTPTPTPTRPRRAPSPGRSGGQDRPPARMAEAVPGEHGSWAAACPEGQRLRPSGTKRPRHARRGSGEEGSGHSPRGEGGPVRERERGGPGLHTEGALAAGRARRPRRGPGLRAGLASAAARCGNRSAGAGSGARRPGQRRRRLPLLLPGSLFPRVLLLAGSPPPPQLRRFSGFSSPSRPGRPAETIPESEGLLLFPAAVGGHL